MLKTIKYASALTAVAGLLQLTSISAQADSATESLLFVDEASVTASRISDAPTVRVPYGDLNVASAAGIETLTGRINGAVKDLCGSSADLRDLRAHLAQKSCQQEAFSDAMAQVDDLISQRKLAAR